MKTEPWWVPLRGRHAYSVSAEEETQWCRDCFCAGIILGWATGIPIALGVVLLAWARG